MIRALLVGTLSLATTLGCGGDEARRSGPDRGSDTSRSDARTGGDGGVSNPDADPSDVGLDVPTPGDADDDVSTPRDAADDIGADVVDGEEAHDVDRDAAGGDADGAGDIDVLDGDEVGSDTAADHDADRSDVDVLSDVDASSDVDVISDADVHRDAHPDVRDTGPDAPPVDSGRDATADVGPPPERCDPPREPTPEPDIEATCDRWHDGGIMITSSDDPDWAALRDAECVRGGVVIEDSVEATISLPGLRYIDGNLLVWSNHALTELALPDLAIVSGELSVSTSARLETLNLSSLSVIGGDVAFESVRSLDTLSLPLLEWVGGSFEMGSFTEETSVRQVVAPRLVAVQGHRLMVKTDGVVDVSLPSLTHVGRGSGLIRIDADDDTSYYCGIGCASSAPMASCWESCGALEATVDLSSLCEAGSVDIEQNATAALSIDLSGARALGTLRVGVGSFGSLARLALDELARVEGSLIVRHRWGYGLPDDVAFRAPALEELGRSSVFAPAGTRVLLPVLGAVDSLELTQLTAGDTLGEPCAADCDETVFETPLLERAEQLGVDGVSARLEAAELVAVTARLSVTGPATIVAPRIAEVGWLAVEGSDGRVFDALRAATIEQIDIDDPIVSTLTLEHVEALERLDVGQRGDNEVFTTLALPALRSVGTMTVFGIHIEVVEAPMLASCDELSLRSLRSLTRVELPSLSTVGTLSVESVGAGASAVTFDTLERAEELAVRLSTGVPSFSSLAETGKLLVGGNRETLRLPSLTTAGEVLVTWGDPAPVQLDALTSVGTLDIADGEGTSVTAGAFPSLADIREFLLLDDAEFDRIELPALTEARTTYVRRSGLEELSLPSLTSAGGFTVQRNEHLAALDIGELAACDWLRVEDNPLLSTCDVRDVAEDLAPYARDEVDVCVRGNRSDCPDHCP